MQSVEIVEVAALGAPVPGLLKIRLRAAFMIAQALASPAVPKPARS